MSLEKTLFLGFFAGVTILLGLPIARLKRPAPGLRMMLNAIAVGILIFLVWDVLTAAWAPIDAALSRFQRAYTQSHGAVLVTGPTGSGKSTTLYAALTAVNTPDRHIITIEDPVEYQLDGIT